VLAHPNLLPFKGYHSISEEEMCGSFHTLNIYYSYIEHSLSREITTRAQTNVLHSFNALR